MSHNEDFNLAHFLAELACLCGRYHVEIHDGNLETPVRSFGNLHVMTGKASCGNDGTPSDLHVSWDDDPGRSDPAVTSDEWSDYDGVIFTTTDAEPKDIEPDPLTKDDEELNDDRFYPTYRRLPFDDPRLEWTPN